MSVTRRRIRFLAIIAIVALVATACKTKGGGTTTSPAAGGAGNSGGQAVFGAEQWPQCLNPITSCAYSSWYAITAQYPTMPRLMELDTSGNFVASPLLTEAPSLENGGVIADPFSVTFNLNPEANWADGTPITSADIEFTWNAIMNTRGAISRTGYDKITSVDTSDPKTAVIDFSEPVVDWPDLFGGGLQFVLEKAAFPDVDQAKPDLSKEMIDNIPFSGGPWVLQSWDKQQEVLVRNDGYFGHKALLDQVTFVRRQNQTTEANSLKSGEVAAIFPQPSNVSLIDQFADTPTVQVTGGGGPYWEAIHFNHEAPPLNDPKVREAFLYAVDRQAVVDALIKINNPDAQVLNCFGWLPDVGQWCNQQDYAGFTYDPAQAISILEGDGYDCSKVPNDPCTKDGEPLSFEWTITAGNDRRADTTALVQEGAKAAGFDLSVKAEDPTFLFSNLMPKGEFVMTEFAFGGSPDPSVTSIMACDQIPTEKNGYSGQNTDFWCNQAATKLMHGSDAEVDPAKRLDMIHQIGQIGVKDFAGVPLYVLPQVTAWRTDKIAGPIDVWNGTIYSSFFNMDQWYLP